MDASRDVALRRGVTLEVVTIAWMTVEAVVSIGAGVAARSVLLTAFGFDSVVELLSGVVLFRRLSTRTGTNDERVERIATRISAVLLLVLCAYVALSSAAGLLFRIEPSGSYLGLAISVVAVVAMPLLARAKRNVNRVLQSPSLRADIAETVSCAYLAAVTVAGLAASMLFGLWWAQYAAALGLLVWLVPETREALAAGRDNEPHHRG